MCCGSLSKALHYHCFLCLVTTIDRLVGLVVKASASRAEDRGFESRLCRDFFGVESFLWLNKLALQWLPCQAPGVIGSVLGLVAPVSVYCDWVRWKKFGLQLLSSVWQHVKLSEQIRPWDTLACCWDVKQHYHCPLTQSDHCKAGCFRCQSVLSCKHCNVSRLRYGCCDKLWLCHSVLELESHSAFSSAVNCSLVIQNCRNQHFGHAVLLWSAVWSVNAAWNCSLVI